MHSTFPVKKPCIVIMHLKTEEEKAVQFGTHLPYYQVTIDPENDRQLSPTGDFIRFGFTVGDEYNGWMRSMNVVIDEVIQEWTPAYLESLGLEEIPSKNKLRKAA